MEIMFNDLSKQWEVIKDDVNPRLEKLFQKSDFIGGQAVKDFEQNFAEYCNTEHAIGVSNGTDALKLSLKALDLESPCGVIIPANTFIATALAATYLSDKDYNLILIDCDEYYQIDTELLDDYLEKNRDIWESCVIIPVHLYGHPCNMERILKIAENYNCNILEDSSQAHGSEVIGKRVGSLGDISAFSLYPGKNLGAAGDAGVITTNKSELCDKVKSLRNYGSSKKYHYDFKGWNNRLDTIQAIIVDEKLKHLDQWNDKRIQIAQQFNEALGDNQSVIIPKSAPYIDKQVYHIYAIRVKKREKLQNYLRNKGIPTIIHYPIPIEKTKPFRFLESFKNKRTLQYADELVSLPMHPFLSQEEIDYIVSKINSFDFK